MKHILTLMTVILSVASVHAQDSFESALKAHVRALTSPSMQGRSAGTQGEASAAAYISKSFEKAGVEWLYPNGYQDFSFVNTPASDTLFSRNVVAVIPGYDPKLKEEYIVIGAHYDHLGTYTMKVNGKDSTCIYSGADANASGVAALLELAAAAQGRHFLYKRSLLFVAFGAEEKGSIGAWYFANRAFPVSSIKLMVNLDRMGRSSVDNYPMAFTGSSHYELERLLRLGSTQPYMPGVKVFGSDYFVSSHQAFMQKDIPVVLFTTGNHEQVNTLRDTPERLDYAQEDAFCQYIMNFLMEAANGPNELFSKKEQVAQPSGEAPIYAFADVDKEPKYQNSDLQSFADGWIYKYLKYPQEAVRNGIKGRVMVSFIVEADGQVTHVEVQRSVDPLLDNEAVRVISASPKWKPGEKNGAKVRVKIVVPVYFELSKTK